MLQNEAGIAGIRGRPGFATAFWILIDRYLALHNGHLVNKLVASEPRYFVTAMVFILQAEYLDGLNPDGVTIAGLVRRCRGPGLTKDGISRGQVIALVELMRKKGRLVLAEGGADRRARRLVPSEAMVIEHRSRTALHFEALDVLFPGSDLLRRLMTDPSFFWAVERARGQLFARLGNPLRHFPRLLAITRHDSGYTVLSCLLQATYGRPGLPQPGICALPYAACATRIGISRTQVRRSIGILEEAGLVTVLGRGGEAIQIHPELVDDVANMFAARLLRFKVNAEAALNSSSPALDRVAF
jgi:hypothetical protein